MKALAAGAAIAICLGLSACAGSAGSNGVSRSEPFGRDVDYVKIDAVTQWAHQRGATVVWLNYPVRQPRARPDQG